MRSYSRRGFVKVAASAGVTLAATRMVPAAVFAQDGLPPLPDGATVVASNLFNPRNLAWGADGTLYITENGYGGDEVLGPSGPPEEEASATPEATPIPEGSAPPSTRGYTGRISAVAPDGTQSIVAEGLASYSDGVGPVGIDVVDGMIVYSIGSASVLAGLVPLPEEGKVHQLDPATGASTEIADILSYEVANNPDGTDVNPNLYGLRAHANGIAVNDAGGNVTYQIEAGDNTLSVLEVYPTLDMLPTTSADPAAAGRQVVPTGLAIDPVSGEVIVAFLGEFWPADAPSIVVASGDGSLEPVASGLSMIVDLAYGPDGLLYASVLTHDLETFAPGGVLRINADGTAEEVVPGLFMPHGIIFDEEGNLYVSVYALASGPDFPAGQVVRIDGVAAVA